MNEGNGLIGVLLDPQKQLVHQVVTICFRLRGASGQHKLKYGRDLLSKKEHFHEVIVSAHKV